MLFLLQLTTATYYWCNFRVQLNYSNYSMFLRLQKITLIKQRVKNTLKQYKSFSKIEREQNFLHSVSRIMNFQVHDSAKNSWQGERKWPRAKVKTGLRTFQSINRTAADWFWHSRYTRKTFYSSKGRLWGNGRPPKNLWKGSNIITAGLQSLKFQGNYRKHWFQSTSLIL